MALCCALAVKVSTAAVAPVDRRRPRVGILIYAAPDPCSTQPGSKRRQLFQPTAAQTNRTDFKHSICHEHVSTPVVSVEVGHAVSKAQQQMLAGWWLSDVKSGVVHESCNVSHVALQVTGSLQSNHAAHMAPTCWLIPGALKQPAVCSLQVADASAANLRCQNHMHQQQGRAASRASGQISLS
jgi:hypothetical protein